MIAALKITVLISLTLVALVKLFNCARGCGTLLFTRVEWVTHVADVDAEVASCRCGLDHVATRTGDSSRYVVRVDVWFHNILSILGTICGCLPRSATVLLTFLGPVKYDL